MNIDALKFGLDIGSIATWVMAVGVAILIYLEKAGKSKRTSHKSPKK